MRPDVKLVLRLGAVFGFSPYGVHQDGELFFKWRSTRAVYFLFTLFINYFCLGYAAFACYKEYLLYSLSKALEGAGWVGFFLVTASVFTLILFQRNSLMNYLNITGRAWHKYDEHIKEKNKKASMIYFYLWTILGFVFTIGSITNHQYYHPENPMYFNNIIGYHDQSMPLAVRLVSMILFGHVIVLCFGGMLFSDYLTTSIAYGYKVSFMEINESLKACYSHEIEANFTNQVSTFSKLNQIHPIDVGKVASDIKQIEMKGHVYETIMKNHYTNQKCLKVFNQTFASFILLFILQCFLMMICLFYVIFTKGHTFDKSTLLVYLVNGVQYMMRCATVLHVMGSVRTAAGGIKDIIVKDIGMGEVAHNSPLMFQLHLFLQDCTNVGVDVGEYIAITPGFSLTFFGALGTYLAILVQSV